MPLLDVRVDHLKIVQEILQQFVPERAVWAFGSRAKWLAKEYSDLDLCIVGETPLSFRTLGLIEEAFEESDLPYKVDVVDWATTSQSFRKIIERDRVVVQKVGRGGVVAPSSEWTEASLGEVLELKRGYDLPKGKRTQGHVPIVSSSGVSDFHFEAMVKGPGVVTGRYGTIGEVFYVEEDYWPLNTTLYVRDFKGNDPRFISYFLKTLDFHAYSDKGAVPGVNRNHLHLARVRVPGLGTQRRIAQMLSVLDDKITVNRRINQTLEAMAQAIFKSWFVDFDPVKAKIAAKAEGRDPLRAVMTAISGKSDAELDTLPPDQLARLAATAALFPDAMVDSELGEMPKGWHASTLGEQCVYLNRGISPKYIDDGGVLVLNQKCIRDFSLDLSKGRRHDPSQRSVSGRDLQQGDVLVNSTGVGTLGRVAQVLRLDEPTIVDSHVTVVRSGANLNSAYLGQWFVMKQPDIEAMGEGSTGQTELSRGKLATMSILVPNLAVLGAFAAAVAPMQSLMSSRNRESLGLQETRDALLPRLLSGELKPSGALEGAEA